MSFKFAPPAGLDEMSAAARDAWHAEVNGYFTDAKAPLPFTFAGSRNQFFNPANGVKSDAIEKAVGWTAFPRPISIAAGSDVERWAEADADRHEQVEYCEWSVTRDAAGKITRIDFTCEDRRYFKTLFDHQPDTVLALYREHVSPNVELTDLQDPFGNYLSTNRWNMNVSSGAMHMIGGPNTIGAAVSLVAGACVVRLNPDGTPKTAPRDLTGCGGFGDRERHSDPTIGSEVNELARAGHEVSLALPAQLAFESVSFAGWTTPDGSAAEDYWTYTRGVDGQFVRGVLSVPEDKGFTVGDIEIDNRKIQFGGQVADRIRIKVTGLAQNLGQARIEPERGCIGDPIPEPGPAVPVLPRLRRS